MVCFYSFFSLYPVDYLENVFGRSNIMCLKPIASTFKHQHVVIDCEVRDEKLTESVYRYAKAERWSVCVIDSKLNTQWWTC